MIVANDVVHDSRVLKEARALRDAGHEVSFIGWDRSGKAPATEDRGGIVIRRVRTRGALRAVPTTTLRNPLWWRLAYRIARTMPFDVVHCHDLDALPIGVRLKGKFRKPLVYDCHEVFGYMIEHDVPRFVTRYAFRLERRLSRHADRVIAVNEYVKAYVDPVSGHDSVVIRNCSDQIEQTYRAPPAAPFTLLYVGTLHASRFVLEAIDAVATMPDVRLVIGGSKSLTPLVREKCSRWPNTQFVGTVPNERVLPMTVESHAVLSMFDPRHRINRVGLPNKIFEAMAAGRPCIATEGLPMSSLLIREQCGIAVPYTQEGFRVAVEKLREDPAFAERLGRNGLDAAHREYNWRHESKNLLALYDGFMSS